jgi:OOP family OmpA-OmpF porin
MQRMMVLVSFVAMFFLTSTAPAAASEVKGMIKGRTGETLIVNTGAGDVTVVLTDDTRTKDDKGLFGLDKVTMSNAVLIPGLKVKVEGSSDDQGRVVAKTITVDGDDLETSQMIQAGLHPTAEQVATNVAAIEANKGNIETNRQNVAGNKQGIEANQQQIAAHAQRISENKEDIESNTNRFMTLADYEVKGQTTVKFGVAGTKLSKEDQAELAKLAESAKGLTGYIVEVTGYADATGSAAMNTKLSKDRAIEVVNYLFQQCQVPMLHIVAPGAMGEYGPAATNETKAGRAENRRVEVKVLVNKGIVGG